MREREGQREEEQKKHFRERERERERQTEGEGLVGTVGQRKSVEAKKLLNVLDAPSV